MCRDYRRGSLFPNRDDEIVRYFEKSETQAITPWARCHNSGVTESREGANIIKTILDVRNLKAKLAERVFVEPHEIPLPAVSGRGQRVVHAN